MKVLIEDGDAGSVDCLKVSSEASCDASDTCKWGEGRCFYTEHHSQLFRRYAYTLNSPATTLGDFVHFLVNQTSPHDANSFCGSTKVESASAFHPPFDGIKGLEDQARCDLRLTEASCIELVSSHSLCSWTSQAKCVLATSLPNISAVSIVERKICPDPLRIGAGFVEEVLKHGNDSFTAIPGDFEALDAIEPHKWARVWVRLRPQTTLKALCQMTNLTDVAAVRGVSREEACPADCAYYLWGPSTSDEWQSIHGDAVVDFCLENEASPSHGTLPDQCGTSLVTQPTKFPGKPIDSFYTLTLRTGAPEENSMVNACYLHLSFQLFAF